jgi:hypothetical protein
MRVSSNHKHKYFEAATLVLSEFQKLRCVCPPAGFTHSNSEEWRLASDMKLRTITSNYVMKASIFFAKNKGYLQFAKQWFFKTPDRALNRAYAAALIIKSLEYEYFYSDKIPTNSTQYNDFMMLVSQAKFRKLLIVIQLRLTEFQASNSVIIYPKLTHAETIKRINENVEKLRVIDAVLNKYIPKKKSLSGRKVDQNNQNNPSKVSNPPSLITIEVPATKVPFK